MSAARYRQTIQPPSFEEPSDEQATFHAILPTLRKRLIEDMTMRRFSTATQRCYIRDVAPFAAFLGRPPDTTTSDDARHFQVEQQKAGVFSGLPDLWPE